MTKKLFIGIFACCFMLSPPVMRAQQYSYVNYNIRDGLAGSVVYSMAQDHDGFIWFGTETGLSRFDGTQFKNFTTANGLPENEIVQIKVDSKNRVWVLPFSNRICYFLNGQLHTEQNDSLLRRLNIRMNVSSLVQSGHGEIAIVERNRLSIVDVNDTIKTYQVFGDTTFFTHAGTDFEGRIVVVATIYGQGAFVFRPTGDSLVRMMDVTEFNLGTQNGQFFSSRLSLLYKVDSIRIQVPGQRYSIPSPHSFINLAVLNDSLVAITSLNKTYTFNYRRRQYDREFFRGKNITNVLEDTEGNLWFSSVGDGVYRLPSTRFRSWQFSENGQRLPVYSLLKRNETMWVGTDQYLVWKLNTITNSLQKETLTKGPTSGRVVSIVGYAGDRLMIGTDNGPYYLDENNKFKLTEPFAVKSMFAFGDTVLIGAGLASYFSVGRIPFFPHFLLYRRTTSVYRNKNLYYFGTLNGLYVKRWLLDSAEYLGGIHPALSDRISMLAGSDNGPLWVATSGYGVARYENRKVTAVLNTDSGLTSNIVRTLFLDKGILWVGTDKGLNKVENIQGRYRVTRFTTSDGLISNMINALYVEDNGKMVYVGTPEGLTSFNEDSVFTNSSCVLRITNIQSARQRMITETRNIRFEHFDNNIRFEFTGISFKSAGEITYHYRLTGLEDNWHTTTDNFLNYPTLPSGEYILGLQAINKFGVKSEQLSIPFTIEKLLWERPWFQVLAIVAVAALVWIFVSWRIRKIRREVQAKADTNRKMAALEQLAMRAQMNPHFIFNSLNSIQHYMFDKDIEGANRFIADFSRLIRFTLDLGSRARISLDDEINFLTTYLDLEKLRFEDKFNYRIHVDERLELNHCFIPPMILQPYIENSIRHGVRYRQDNKGMIFINLEIVDDHLECSVEDNGIGRERSAQLKGQTSIEYQSKGMMLTARRIELMNLGVAVPTRIQVIDLYQENKAAGTRVVIRIPLAETSKTIANHDTSSPY